MKTAHTDPKKLVYLLCQRVRRFREQGRYAWSETLFQQAPALVEQSFAPELLEDALVLVAVLNNHAVLYKYSALIAPVIAGRKRPAAVKSSFFFARLIVFRRKPRFSEWRPRQ